MGNRHNLFVAVVSCIIFPLIVWYAYYNFGKIESIITWTGYTDNMRGDIYNQPEFDFHWVINNMTCKDLDLEGEKMKKWNQEHQIVGISLYEGNQFIKRFPIKCHDNTKTYK